MIARDIDTSVQNALKRQASVALIGPRQMGKTTLALTIGENGDALYLDLEDMEDRNKLANPKLLFEAFEDRLVILDEIHQMPDLFDTLRGVIDAFLSETDAESFEVRKDFIRTYLQRDIPMFGPRVPVTTMERLWTMLAHNQSTLLNASQLAKGLNISPQSVTRYIDLLCDLLLVRRLPPYHAIEDLKPEKSFLVHGAEDRYPIAENIEAIGVLDLAYELHNVQ